MTISDFENIKTNEKRFCVFEVNSNKNKNEMVIEYSINF
jgi:hypothetical protein